MSKVEPPLIVIVGPTASGKTGLSIELALKYSGEIISADSRAIYRGLDVGTAKPTVEERRGVPHWAIDLIDIGESFTAADFQKYTKAKIKDIRKRGKVPFLVGGTGLYIDSILYEYQFGAQADKDLRETLERLSIDELIEYCKNNNIELPSNVKNKRHLVRSIEQGGINRKRSNRIIDNTHVVGISTEITKLKQRIEDRAKSMFEDGVIQETELLMYNHGLTGVESAGIPYKETARYLQGEITADQAIQSIASSDRKLAKRQITWFKRNNDIKWMNLEHAHDYIDDILANNPRS